MNRFVSLLALALLFAVLAASPAAAQKRDFSACGSKDADTRIAVCTRGISSGLWRGNALAIGYNNRGWGYNDKGEFDRALVDLNEAIRIDPRQAYAYINRGLTYNAKADYDRAIADYSEAIRINPKIMEAHSGRGVAYGWKTQYDQGIADLNEALRLKPNDAGALGTRGWLLTQKRDFDRAMPDLNEAIRLNPKNGTFYHNRGNAFFGKNDPDRAIADYTEAVRLDPKLVSSYQSRGFLFHQKRDYDRAIADYSEAMRIEPKNMLSFHYRGRAFREKGDHDRAIADFNEAHRLNPKQAYPLLGRGLTLEAKGDLSGAYRDVVEALALDPSNAEGQQIRDRLRAALVGPVPTAPKADPTAAAALPAPAPTPPQVAPAPAPSLAIAGPRVALVIGNGKYQHATALPNPANDAADISASLRKLGFEVIEGRDLDKRGMEDKVRQFGRKLDGAKLALFFYAGHGLQVGGRNYLIPVDGKLERQGDLSFETIDVSQVLAQMESEQRVNLVFLDACRDNPLSRSFARALGTRSSAVGQGLASIQSAVGTMIAYATQPDAVALDGTGRNSPFTTALLKHINTRGLEIGSMMRRVRAEVVQVTNGKQVPWDHSSLLGDIVLVQ